MHAAEAMTSDSASDTHVAVHGVCKRFGGTHALRDVDLEIRRGSVHALVGENGAGKSTLGKIVAGVISPDTGEMWIGGRRVHYHSPHRALADGITLIAQETALVPGMSVMDNVLLGVESVTAGVIRGRQMRRRFEELGRHLDLHVAPDTPVASLRIADQQKVEILRAIARDAKLIVMDEPTAVLSPDESARLFETIRWLTSNGTTVIYVSHFLEEVLALAETVTVMRNGRVVRTRPAAQETTDQLVEGMLGRALELTFPAKTEPDRVTPPVLEVRDLAAGGFVRDVSFDVHGGEIVGFAGLVGSGRSEVAQAIFGGLRMESGRITVEGREVHIDSPRAAIDAGLALVPESRKDQGLVLGRSPVENVALPHMGRIAHHGVFTAAGERRRVMPLIARMGVRGSRGAVSGLSGGNQQKVLFSKWLLHEPRIFIADEPTRGVDVGAKRAIYEVIHSLAAEGRAVVLISSELEEVLGLAHRLLVMRKGRVVAELRGDELAEENVMRAAFGVPTPTTEVADV